MHDYYAILTVSPDAGTQELEAAIENQYNAVRRLTTHHDSNIVNQANQALSILEQARTTLLDPARRSEYDAALGIGVAGIADPELISSKPTPATMPVTAAIPAFGGYPSSAPLVGRAPAIERWICQHCQRENPMGTLFCQSCGEAVGRICPSCQATYEARARFCPGCGESFENASQRVQLSTALSQKTNERYALANQAGGTSSPRAQSLEYLAVGGAGFAIFAGLSTVHFVLVTIARLGFSLMGNETLAQPAVRTIVEVMSGFNTLVRWIIWMGVIALFSFLMRKKGLQLATPAVIGYSLLSLLALAFGGPSFQNQIFYRIGNFWLMFPAMVMGAMIALAWLLLRQYAEPCEIPNLNLASAAFKRVEPYVARLLHLYNQSPVAVAGLAIGLSGLTFLFSSSRSILSLFVGLLSLGTCAVLALLAYRAYQMVSFEKAEFATKQQEAQEKLALLESEIAGLEQRLQALPSPSQLTKNINIT